MPSSIMLVENEESIRRLLEFILGNEGYEVVSFADGGSAIKALDGYKPDLVVLDWMMPGISGFDISRELRARKEFDKVPIVFLTAKDQMVDKLAALAAGADGYITKPFESIELVLSIKAFLRLAAKEDAADEVDLEVNGVTLEPAKYLVTIAGRKIQLTRSETALLRFMMEHPQAIFSADELARQVLGQQGSAPSVDAVHAHIRNLRTKIELEPKSPHYLLTMGRKGYTFAN